jgi:hypothetical protein
MGKRQGEVGRRKGVISKGGERGEDWEKRGEGRRRWERKGREDGRRKGGMQGGREREMRVYNIEGREERGGGMIK